MFASYSSASTNTLLDTLWEYQWRFLCCLALMVIFVRANIYLCETLALSLILTLYWLWISLPSVISLSRDLILMKYKNCYTPHTIFKTWDRMVLQFVVNGLIIRTRNSSVLSQMIYQEMYKISAFFTSAKSNHPTNITSG